MASLTDEEVKAIQAVAWAEARGEPRKGQKAVVDVILNRTYGTAAYPDSVVGVIEHVNSRGRVQFDPMKGRTSWWQLPTPPDEGFKAAIAAHARGRMNGTVSDLTNGSTIFSNGGSNLSAAGTEITIGKHSFGVQFSGSKRVTRAEPFATTGGETGRGPGSVSPLSPTLQTAAADAPPPEAKNPAFAAAARKSAEFELATAQAGADKIAATLDGQPRVKVTQGLGPKRPLEPHQAVKNRIAAAVHSIDPSLTVHVYSGRQSFKRQKGSPRHNTGNTVDFYIQRDGVNVPTHSATHAAVAGALVKFGLNEIGVGMSRGGIHAGFGTPNRPPAMWGYFGDTAASKLNLPRYKEHVRAVQRALGVTADGIYGKETIRALKAVNVDIEDPTGPVASALAAKQPAATTSVPPGISPELDLFMAGVAPATDADILAAGSLASLSAPVIPPRKPDVPESVIAQARLASQHAKFNDLVRLASGKPVQGVTPLSDQARGVVTRAIEAIRTADPKAAIKDVLRKTIGTEFFGDTKVSRVLGALEPVLGRDATAGTAQTAMRGPVREELAPHVAPSSPVSNADPEFRAVQQYFGEFNDPLITPTSNADPEFRAVQQHFGGPGPDSLDDPLYSATSNANPEFRAVQEFFGGGDTGTPAPQPSSTDIAIQARVASSIDFGESGSSSGARTQPVAASTGSRTSSSIDFGERGSTSSATPSLTNTPSAQEIADYFAQSSQSRAPQTQQSFAPQTRQSVAVPRVNVVAPEDDLTYSPVSNANPEFRAAQRHFGGGSSPLGVVAPPPQAKPVAPKTPVVAARANAVRLVPQQPIVLSAAPAPATGTRQNPIAQDQVTSNTPGGSIVRGPGGNLLRTVGAGRGSTNTFTRVQPAFQSNSSGSNAGTIICTYFKEQGRVSRTEWYLNGKYSHDHYAPSTIWGYHLWAVPLVRAMRSGVFGAEMLGWGIFRVWHTELMWRMGRRDSRSQTCRLVCAALENLCAFLGKWRPETWHLAH